MAQREGKTCAFLDAEGTFDKEWAKKMGVDTEQLIYSPVKSINNFTDLTVELCNAGIDVIVVDSLTTLLPGIFFEKDSDELKPMSETGQIGSISRDLGNALKMINYVNEKTLLVLISQVRFNIGSLYASHTFTGGNAVKFYSSIIVKLFSSESANNAIESEITIGDKIIKQKVGREVSYNIEFSKTSAPFVTGKYDFYFQGDFVGVDRVADVVDTAEMLGIIEKGGAWYTVLDQRLQGRAKVIEYLKNNPEGVIKLEEEILSKC
jgi:recombination protein RecA